MAKRFPMYERMLRLYPEAYRERYAAQMLQTLEDMIDDQPTRFARLAIRLRAIAELPCSIAQQRILVIGGIMHHQTPHYLKRDALIGAILIVPFFITIASGILQNQPVMDNHAWAAFFTVLIIVLPAIAFVLNSISFMRWSVHESRQRKTSLWKHIFDFAHSWRQLLVGGLGLFIVLLVLGHDSAHCIAGNPYGELRNWHQTKQCIDTGFAGRK
jgi:hypothetical protein